MKLVVKCIVSVIVSCLWLFGVYKAGNWLGTVLAEWINDD